MKVLITATVHVFLIYILMFKDWKESYFIFSDLFDEDITKRLNINNKHIYQGRRNKRFYKIRYKIFCLYLSLLSFFSKKEMEIYGQDHIYESGHFLKKNFTVIEDGIASYMKIESVKQFCEKFYPNRKYLILGYDKNINKVILTGILPIPENLKSKCEVVNLKEKWEKISDKEKSIILSLFDINKEQLTKYSGGKTFLVTQNLPLNEEEKVTLYQKILRKEDYNSIIIKPHPLETTDYGKYFPGALVIKEKFPFELLALLDLNIKKIMTINSTCVFFFDEATDVEFYNIHGDFRTREEVIEKLDFHSLKV